jgi:hypothetical protein
LSLALLDDSHLTVFAQGQLLATWKRIFPLSYTPVEILYLQNIYRQAIEFVHHEISSPVIQVMTRSSSSVTDF